MDNNSADILPVTTADITAHNAVWLEQHSRRFNALREQLIADGCEPESIIAAVGEFQVAVPSWALGTGGTRFGRFPIGGEPRSLREKLLDAALLNRLSGSTNAISLHIPWDIPDDHDSLRSFADTLGIGFAPVNSNTFQDQPSQAESYKFGSLSHTDTRVRDRAIAHNIEVIRHGSMLGSKALTIWLADGSSFPGQISFRRTFERTSESLRQIYTELPPDWRILLEYKPFEPGFYSMVIQDWGTSLLLCERTGDRCFSLVDLGHHLPNTNIEQIVSRLSMAGRLGGFHFNDSRYGDDDVTVGSIKPYQLFLIFTELTDGIREAEAGSPAPEWMIDASHNVKDPLEDLLQSVEAILIAYAQSLLVDSGALHMAQEENDVVRAQELLQHAFRTDVRPLVAESRLRKHAALYPLKIFREKKVRSTLVDQRGSQTLATGL